MRKTIILLDYEFDLVENGDKKKILFWRMRLSFVVEYQKRERERMEKWKRKKV